MAILLQILVGVGSGLLMGAVTFIAFGLIALHWMLPDVIKLCQGARTKIMMISGTMYLAVTVLCAGGCAYTLAYGFGHPNSQVPWRGLPTAITICLAALGTSYAFWRVTIRDDIDRQRVETACSEFDWEFVRKQPGIFAVDISPNRHPRQVALIVHATDEAIFATLPDPYQGVRLRLEPTEPADLAPGRQ